ncbi:MAG: S8 family serine peptidase, partial [Ferruginibacter sp.]
NYTYASMDGNTTLSAKGADMAAKKGIICVLAAGNEGNGAWHYIITPSDADSVMAVGAVSTSGAVGSFSSYGPSSDGQIKPSVAAVGVSAVIANSSNGQPSFGSGTSFACPNMAGLTTCLWQAFPEVNNMRIITVMQESATRATNPNDRIGYGIPDMKKAFVKLIKQLYTQQSAVANCAVILQWTAKTDSAISVVVERKLPAETNYTAINTQTSTGAFQSRNFSFSDDLRSFPTTGVWYRIRMNIAADTSFILDSMLINFTPRPNLGVDKSASACSGNTVNLTTQFNTTGLATVWTLAGNAVATPAAVSAPGIYQLVATNTNGCADTAAVTVTINPKPALGADLVITKCTDSIVNLTTLFTTTGLTTAWTIGGNPVANPSAVTAAGVYQLIGANGFSCADTALVTIANSQPLCPGNPPALSDQIYINYCPGISPIKPCNPPITNLLPVYVSRSSASQVDIMVYNSEGKIVYKFSDPRLLGIQIYNIPMQNLSAGVYIVKVKINNGNQIVKKIFKSTNK